MRLRITTMFMLAAALSLGATAASAQDATRRARSTTRIPVTKEAAGEVVPPRVDTVMIYRTDTLRVFRTDTVTRYRTDTMRVELPPPMPKPLRQIGGFYYGIGVGAALTTGDLDNGQNGGFHLQVPIGWDPIGSPVGVRLDGTYSTFSRNSLFDNSANALNQDFGNPQIYTFNANLKLRIPMLSAYATRWQAYGIGGGSYSYFKNVLEVGDGLISVGDNVGVAGAFPTAVDNSWHGKWGWNAGGGIQYGWGRANVYAEARTISFDNRLSLRQVPVVVGFTWF